MGMTANQLSLVRYVAENNLQKAKEAALACCVEDQTQKNRWATNRYEHILRSGAMNLIELPANISSFTTMEDLSNSYLENRYYLTEEEKSLFQLIKNMNDVSLQLMERKIPYLNATLLYGESGVGKTEFSKYVAYKLEMPYLYVNFSKMLDSYLGGTAKNLTNLFNYINQQKSEKHELHRLSREDNEKFMIQYLEDTGFAYDLKSLKEYAAQNHSQAEIMTHVTRRIADSLIHKKEQVVL